MAADYTRIHRLLKILTLIQSQDGWNAPKLAAECGTTRRNIYRDMHMLEGAGIPYFYDEESDGYCIRKDFFMPAVSLTLEESLALVTLAEQVGGAEQIPFTRAAARAIEKVKCSLPSGVRRELSQIDPHLAIKLPPAAPPEGSADVYETVQRALAERRILCCRYEAVTSQDPDGDGGDFELRPYTLFFCQRAWYVVGHHGGRSALRNLKLNRFTRCQLTDNRYEIPKSFSLEKHLGHAWRMIRGRQPYQVELEFDARFAENIADTQWHATQEIEWREDGSILFRCTVDGLDEIVWWVMGMGPHCRVNAPQELADRVKTLAADVLKLYQPAKKPARSASKTSSAV